MEKFELIAPCHFGMEAVLKREILDLGYEITKVEDGKVTFEADAQGIADANIFLRSTERILLKVAEVKAETFDELFEKTKALPWENYIPKDGKFWVAKANSVKSKLFSPDQGSHVSAQLPYRNDMKKEIYAVRGNCEAEVDQMVLQFPVMADYCILNPG